MQAKRIQVKNLPDGFYKDQLMHIAKTPEVEVVVVAKPGYAGDWAAYIGFPPYNDFSDSFKQRYEASYYGDYVSEPADVADRGDKLAEADARSIFQGTPWCDLRYRR